MGAFFRQYRPFFLYAGVFSLFINLLLLVPALYMLQVFERVLMSRHEETLVLLTALVVGALVTMLLLETIRSMLLARAAITIDKALGPRVLESLVDALRQPGPAPNLHGFRDLSTLRTFLTGPGILSLFDVPWLPVYLLVIYMFHPLLGAVATVGAVALFTLALLSHVLTRKPLEELQREGRRAANFVEQGLRNAEIIGALGMIHGVRASWQAMNDRVLDWQWVSSSWSSRISALAKFMRQFVQVAMLGTGAWLVIRLDVSPGVMIAATILLARALAPMETMIAGWRSLVDARSASERLREMIGRSGDQVRPTALPNPAGELALDNVAFAIRSREQPILRGISFSLAPGESIAIVGPSASGKSTLARLIIGVWRPSAGVIRLDGADIAAWQRDSLGPHVGYLPQDVELFAGTVSANIRRLGDPNDEAVVAAAQRAHAHRMILQLADGYDTEIGEGGSVLSGGQRQRIALARALYGNPRIVVLDEPNSNLDDEGDLALMHAIRDLRANKVTLVLVTHRPALVARMEKVLVLREGRVAFLGATAQFLSGIATRQRIQGGREVAPERKTKEA